MKAKAIIVCIVILLMAIWLLKYAVKLAFFATKWTLLFAIVLIFLVWISSKTSRRKP